MDNNKIITWNWADYDAGIEIRVNVEAEKLISFNWSASGLETTVEFSLEALTDRWTWVKEHENGERGIARLATNAG